MTKRTCGNCRMCCKIMAVPDFPGKPDPHDWCRHACDTGCAIYPQRPGNCRDFNCMWLLDQRIPDYWKPDRSKIVIAPHLALPSKTGVNALMEKQAYVAFIVDPAYPQRWREEPWFSDLKTMANAGLKGLLGGQKWTSVVLIGDARIPIVA